MVYSFITIIITANTARKETMDFITNMVKDYNLSNYLQLMVFIRKAYELMIILFHLIIILISFTSLLVVSSYKKEVRLGLHYDFLSSKIFSLGYI